MSLRLPASGWTGALLMLLVLVTGCSGPAAYVDNAVNVVIRCGPDVSLRFNITGDMRVRTEDILASQCHVAISGSTITLECPGNGIFGKNHTESRRFQIIDGPRSNARPFVADHHNTSGNAH